MDTAIIEFDALPDAIGPAAEHDHLLAVGGLRLALILVGGVQVRGLGGKLGRAGVDALVHGPQSQRMATGAHFRLGGLGQMCEAPIGETHALELSEFLTRKLAKRALLDRQFGVDDFLDLREKPTIDLGMFVDLV